MILLCVTSDVAEEMYPAMFNTTMYWKREHLISLVTGYTELSAARE
jgi:hypothetical protein